MEKPEEKTLYLATLVFPVRDGKVLLGLKKKKIGAGRLNGWGGGVDPGETLRQCAVREFEEETGGVKISPTDLCKVGIVHFKNHKTDGSVFVCTVHMYTISTWTGEIRETEEMGPPQWYSISDLASENLCPADPYWMPRMLSGEKGIAWAEFGPYQKDLIGDVIFQPVESVEEE